MAKKVRTILFILCMSLSAASLWAAETQKPKVVVSIKPIHSLVAAVMQGISEPQLLIKGGGSPHGYLLRPSEARYLADADLVVWVGPELESFLVKPLATLGRNARLLELADELESKLLPLREGGSWEAHAHGIHDGKEEPAEHDEEHDGDGKHGEYNQHLWLDPRLAQQIVAKTAAALTEIDPVHQQQYQDNAARQIERLESLHARLKAKLAPIKGVPYIVFHDAYQYFEAAYGLNAVGSISIDPERKPGAKRIREIRQKIKESRVRCVFSEPQFEPRLVSTIIEGTGAKTGVLDPLGTELQPGPENYFLLLSALADNLVAGLR